VAQLEKEHKQIKIETVKKAENLVRSGIKQFWISES